MEEKNRLDRIEEKLDLIANGDIKVKKEKPFKIPWKGKIGNVKAKKGWVQVIKLGTNKSMDFQKHKIDEGTIMVDETPRLVTPEEVYYYRGKPTIVLPEWSVKPVSATDSYEQAVKEKYLAQGFRLLLNRMKREAITAKKQVSIWLVVGIIAVIAAAGYFAFKGGLFK